MALAPPPSPSAPEGWRVLAPCPWCRPKSFEPKEVTTLQTSLFLSCGVHIAFMRNKIPCKVVLFHDPELDSDDLSSKREGNIEKWNILTISSLLEPLPVWAPVSRGCISNTTCEWFYYELFLLYSETIAITKPDQFISLSIQLSFPRMNFQWFSFTSSLSDGKGKLLNILKRKKHICNLTEHDSNL